MKQDVNYINHHKNANMKMIELKLNPTHISLYNALFLIWNECGFDTELSINRNDVMKLSKIGSANTYTKCLKDLEKAKLLKYKPSHNPLIGSKINLYRFDNSTDNSTAKSSSKGCGNSTDNSIDTLYKLLNKETIKLLNKEYDLVNDNLNSWILKEKDIKSSEEVDYENLINIFNSVCSELPKVKKITKKRKQAINARLKESDINEIKTVFEIVKASPFLNGKSSSGWTADFDWIMNPNNYIKILEGNYADKTPKKQIKESSADEFLKELGLTAKDIGR